MLYLSSSISELNSIGEKTTAKFKKLGIQTVRDLIFNIPRKYEFYPLTVDVDNVTEGKRAVIAYVANSFIDGKNESKKLHIRGQNGTNLWITWFHSPYIVRMIYPGNWYVFLGDVTVFNGTFQMAQPEFFHPADYQFYAGSYMPTYRLTAGLQNKTVFNCVLQAIENIEPLRDQFSDNFRKEHNLISLWDAVKCIHWPANENVLEMAQRRVIFDELFSFVWAVKRMSVSHAGNTYSFPKENATNSLIENLPYELTKSQKEVFKTIRENLNSNQIMNRLVQGDVGCGKTIVAELAMVYCAENGYQSALMAPTEVLAKQHYEEIIRNLGKIGKLDEYNPVYLVGSVPAKEKKQIYKTIKNGETKMIIGTHALIQEAVSFQNLALAIIDEQHRFGVEQRNRFSEKTNNKTHIMIMTATPIPRTTASVLFGGISVSYMKDKPANRLPIINRTVNAGGRDEVYQFLIGRLKDGDQAYIICPLVEGDDYGKKSVETFSKQFHAKYPSVKISTLHGKMSAIKKKQNMEDFSNHLTDVMISTTVVEVGVNVPNATVMIVETANMFGLLQLHQLRGRVGRGIKQSYCFFINAKEEPNEKLEIISSTNDGFEIAEADYKIRKAGKILGLKQSGNMGFKLADVVANGDILKEVSEILLH